MTDHVQVPFTTKNGKQVEVDEGMVVILTELKRAGVETLFSCQEQIYGAAYVLFRAPGTRRFVRELRTWGGFTRASYKREVFFFKKDSYNVSRKFLYITDPGSDYQIEESISFKYGHRIALRWPAEHTPMMEIILNRIAG